MKRLTQYEKSYLGRKVMYRVPNCAAISPQEYLGQIVAINVAWEAYPVKLIAVRLENDKTVWTMPRNCWVPEDMMDEIFGTCPDCEKQLIVKEFVSSDGDIFDVRCYRCLDKTRLQAWPA